MSIRSEMKRCRRCRMAYISNPGGPFRGCPYCRDRSIRRWEAIRNLFKNAKEKD